MVPSMWLPALALCLGAFARLTSAVTWKLNYTVQAPLSAWYGYPPDTPDCTIAGVCSPINTTIPAATLWYWCGWNTKERTEYWVYSSPGPVTVSMMREKDVMNCAIPYLSNMKSCYQMDNSVCDTSNNCYTKIYGFSFVDAACIIIANNEKTSATVSVQVWQYYDSRRYYGTAFAILLMIFLSVFSLGHIAWTCYHQIKNPTHRIDELEKATRAKLATVAAQLPRDDINEGTSLRRGSLLQGNGQASSSTGVLDGTVVNGGASASHGGALANNPSGTKLFDRVKALCGAGPDGGSKSGHHH